METTVRYNEDAFYKLRRRKIALGEMKGEITGYPSIDICLKMFFIIKI